jgi:hypothetical protein
MASWKLGKLGLADKAPKRLGHFHLLLLLLRAMMISSSHCCPVCYVTICLCFSAKNPNCWIKIVCTLKTALERSIALGCTIEALLLVRPSPLVRTLLDDKYHYSTSKYI